MNRTEAREFIIEHSKDYLTPDKSGKGYICPLCGSGTGEHGTGITENPKSKNHFTCWSCGELKNADIFDIIGKQYKLTDFNEQFLRACEEFRIPLDDDNQYKRLSSKPRMPQLTQTKPSEIAQDDEDFREFCNEAARHINQTEYHRGLSEGTLKHFNAGYFSEWRHPKNPTSPESPRLIIPNGKGGYLARDVRANLTEEQQKYAKQRAGKVGLFNVEALKQNAQPVFIVEGEIDAMSIYDVGGQAVALCSVANVKKLLDVVTEQPPQVPLIIALDNDKSGNGASSKIEEGLQQAGFSSYRHYIIPDPFKDPNEFLMRNREEFTKWVKGGEDFVNEESGGEGNIKEWEPPLTGYSYVSDGKFEEDLKKFQKVREIHTGFKNLDEKQEVLYPGHYVLGATPSIGKTSFCLQMANNIARQGNFVMYFALEQNRLELTTKSISQITAERDETRTKELSVTSINIRRGKFFTYGQEAAYKRAVEEYKKFANNIALIELGLDATITSITGTVEKFMSYMGLKPVVFIDYLQIIRSNREKQLTKDYVDGHMRILKKLQSENELVMVVISSFNRTNYTSPVDYESFKETGSIEYTADVLWGMQAQIMANDNLFLKDDKANRSKRKEIDDALGAIPRLLMLKNLKNRYGKKGYSCGFIYDPRFDYFVADPNFKEKDDRKRTATI